MCCAKVHKNRNILLAGMPGSGKSTFGKIYALRTGRTFVDLDQYIEKYACKTIPEIFATEGEDGFRLRELKALRKLERRQGAVIALGGGTLCSLENLKLARSIGLIVHVHAPLDILVARCFMNKEERPLFAKCATPQDLEQVLHNLWEKRKIYYDHADIFINSHWNSLDNMVLELLWYERRFSYLLTQRTLAESLLESSSQQSVQVHDTADTSVPSSCVHEYWNGNQREPLGERRASGTKPVHETFRGNKKKKHMGHPGRPFSKNSTNPKLPAKQTLKPHHHLDPHDDFSASLGLPVG